MKEIQNKQTPFVLKKIEEQLPDNFGEPLFYALCKTFPATHREIIKSAAIIGILYLSHRIAKYPQTKLRTFCCNLREEYAPLPLDCRHYGRNMRSNNQRVPYTNHSYKRDINAKEFFNR